MQARGPSAWTISQTLQLLNSTQKKLQIEERYYDSTSLLKALQVQHIAKSLSEHLYNSQPDLSSNVFHSSKQQCYQPETWSNVRSKDSCQFNRSPRGLSSSSREEINVEVEEIEDLSSPQNLDDAISSDSSARDNIVHHPISSTQASTSNIENSESDYRDFDLNGIDLESMPSLSRQESHSSIPSLYHSDNESDEDDQSEDVLIKDVLDRLILMQNTQITGPRAGIFEKRSHSSTPQHEHIVRMPDYHYETSL